VSDLWEWLWQDPTTTVAVIAIVIGSLLVIFGPGDFDVGASIDEGERWD
jgi:type IV secretory pathway VirB2 component (pilin)